MIQSDVDEDFFTPSRPTTLANIFGSTKTANEENSTLKYVAPKANDVAAKETRRTKENDSQNRMSECLFGLPLFAYELLDGVYVFKGKLGFAIMKIYTEIRLILYDAEKTTLSQTTLSTSEIIIQENNYITYIDDFKKNWSLACSNTLEFSNILKQLQHHKFKIKFEPISLNSGRPIPDKSSNLLLGKEVASLTAEEYDKGSDTDSSRHKKTKSLIVSRMAMVGHSVLPIPPMNDKSSDSSDTNESRKQGIKIRHKPMKNVKKAMYDKNTKEMVLDSEHCSNYSQNTAIVPITLNKHDISPCYVSSNGQILPITQSKVSTNTDTSNCHINNDISVLLTEQRISNSETRININRVTDKVDQLLDKVNQCKSCSLNSDLPSFTMEIYKKLILEYENKIKELNEKVKSLEEKLSLIQNNISIEVGPFNCKPEKDNAIKRLELEIDTLKGNNEVLLNNEDNGKGDSTKLKENEDNLIDQNTKYEIELKELRKHVNDYQNTFNNTVKRIMNTTYHTLSANFEDGDQYSGEYIKQIIATVIKKITMQNLSDGS